MAVESPIIKIFPNSREHEDAASEETLDPICEILRQSEKRDALINALVTHSAHALVITPEYDESRERDTGNKLVFHIFTGESPIDPLALVKLSHEIGKILGSDGTPVSFDCVNIPDLESYFTISPPDKNPFHQVFEELNKRHETSEEVSPIP